MPEFSLTGFAAFLTGIVVESDHLNREALKEGCKVLQEESKRVIGTYDYGWQQLAEATKKDRVSKGYPENEPLLRTGAMKESIEFTVINAHEAEVGSDSDIAVYQELGTSTIPARSFLAGAASDKEKEIVTILAEHSLAPLLGGKPK
jgi:hypothetical protein